MFPFLNNEKKKWHINLPAVGAESDELWTESKKIPYDRISGAYERRVPEISYSVPNVHKFYLIFQKAIMFCMLCIRTVAFVNGRGVFPSIQFLDGNNASADDLPVLILCFAGKSQIFAFLTGCGNKHGSWSIYHNRVVFDTFCFECHGAIESVLSQKTHAALMKFPRSSFACSEAWPLLKWHWPGHAQHIPQMNFT